MLSLKIALLIKHNNEAKKRKLLRLIQQSLNSFEVIPEEILHAAFNSESEARSYCLRNTNYSNRLLCLSKRFILDLRPGLKHYDITCISLTKSYSALCGLSFEQFAKLLNLVSSELKILFPQSRMGDEVSSVHRSSTLRMRVFITLYRLKQGVSFVGQTPLFRNGVS